MNIVSYRFLVLLPFVVMTGAAEQAPRVAMYTKLVCEVHKPNDTADQGYRLPSNLHMFAPGVVTFMSRALDFVRFLVAHLAP